jgi:multisubunit Na+/H+ antiporter MnhG subunit
MTTLRTFFHSARALLGNPRALAIFAGLYALLLASLYTFISTREATVWQVAVTLFLLVVVPLEFFVLQSAILNRGHPGKFPWAQILRDALKLAVVTIPILLLAWALWALLNKWQLSRYPVPQPPITFPGTAPKMQPIYWPSLIFATVRGLLFGVLLPLAAIHLWIEVAGRSVRDAVGGGGQAVLKRLGNVFARAFASESVFTYALGLIFFVAIPYAVLFIPFTVKGTKTDFAIFIARLLLAFLFTLIGWIVTLTALARNSTETAAAPSATSVPDAPPAEAPA